MYVIVLFLGACALLYILRFYFLKSIKKRYAFVSSVKKNLYETNWKLVHVEMFFVFLIFMAGLSCQVIADKCNEGQVFLDKVCTVIFISVVLFSALWSLPVLQRYASYFILGEDYIEYNIAFQNRSKDTVRLQKKDIVSIQETDKYIKILTQNGKDISLQIQYLELVKGFAVLKERLLAFNSEA
jgi:hypothetical protein